MKKRILIATLLLACTYQVHAAIGMFYVGVNAIRNVWHTKQQLHFFPGKIEDPEFYNTGWGTNRDQYTGELLAGMKFFNGTVYGAFEAWYNGTRTTAKAKLEPFSFRTKLKSPYGGRIHFGVQNKGGTIYGILGLGDIEYSSVYTKCNRPGPCPVPYKTASNQMLFDSGIGFNYTYKVNWMFNIEYIRKYVTSSTFISDLYITKLGKIGRQKTRITSDTIQVGVKYAFSPFKYSLWP